MTDTNKYHMLAMLSMADVTAWLLSGLKSRLPMLLLQANYSNEGLHSHRKTLKTTDIIKTRN